MSYSTQAQRVAKTFAARSLRHVESRPDNILFSCPLKHCLNLTEQARVRTNRLEDG